MHKNKSYLILSLISPNKPQTTHMLEVIKEGDIAHPFQFPALQLGQNLILVLLLEQLFDSCLHQDVRAWALLSLGKGDGMVRM